MRLASKNASAQCLRGFRCVVDRAAVVEIQPYCTVTQLDLVIVAPAGTRLRARCIAFEEFQIELAVMEPAVAGTALTTTKASKPRLPRID